MGILYHKFYEGDEIKMNDRQKKKQQQRWVLKHQDKVSRNTMFKRLKLAGFAGYVYNNILLSHYPLRNVKRIYKSTVRKDFPLMLSFVEDACNYDFDWLDYISKGNKDWKRTKEMLSKCI